MAELTSEQVNTLTTNPKNIYNNITLWKNDYVLESLEAYEKLRFNNSSANNNIVKARIKNLYRHVRQDIQRNWKPERFKLIEEKINSSDYIKMLDAYENDISEFLAEVGLTATVHKRGYDTQDAFDEDTAKGL